MADCEIYWSFDIHQVVRHDLRPNHQFLKYINYNGHSNAQNTTLYYTRDRDSITLMPKALWVYALLEQRFALDPLPIGFVPLLCRVGLRHSQRVFSYIKKFCVVC